MRTHINNTEVQQHAHGPRQPSEPAGALRRDSDESKEIQQKGHTFYA